MNTVAVYWKRKNFLLNLCTCLVSNVVANSNMSAVFTDKKEHDWVEKYNVEV